MKPTESNIIMGDIVKLAIYHDYTCSELSCTYVGTVISISGTGFTINGGGVWSNNSAIGAGDFGFSWNEQDVRVIHRMSAALAGLWTI